jgi:hypothetical protein
MSRIVIVILKYHRHNPRDLSSLVYYSVVPVHLALVANNRVAEAPLNVSVN